jgi:predicted phage terminase large subunit-like protein
MRTREERYVVEHVERLRGTAQDVDDAIIRCATMDGRGVPIVVEKEPGSNGEMYASYLTRRLAGWAVTFKPSTGAKETRFRPFAAQCQAGNVSIVRGVWNAPWFDELEVAFAGGAHDDQADSASGAFAELCAGKAWPWISPPGAGRLPPTMDPIAASHASDAPRPALAGASASSRPSGVWPMGGGVLSRGRR